ncbi:hypothetical protein CRUP_000866 [Coryphaenoides rupestris]|nr:hypothetical protein CRUP_000866 [Coryphaenoides rupestris]
MRGIGVPARIVNISQDVLVNEGDNVNLFCLAVGRPEPTVTWKDQKSAATPGLAHSHACHRHPLFIVSITVTHYLNRTGAGELAGSPTMGSVVELAGSPTMGSVVELAGSSTMGSVVELAGSSTMGSVTSDEKEEVEEEEEEEL